MNALKLFAVAAVAAICFMMIAPKSQAQVAVTVGPAPDCP